mmetsp:Transcript_7553/g.10381  ORF Transcript_7553/g.10381 Transcript_7553/m.10381 type:complete len:88 (-) Transcript_7553:193-456(-)
MFQLMEAKCVVSSFSFLYEAKWRLLGVFKAFHYHFDPHYYDNGRLSARETRCFISLEPKFSSSEKNSSVNSISSFKFFSLPFFLFAL